MSEIRVAIVGVGNCASSLIQGIAYYGQTIPEGVGRRPIGLMHWDLGGYLPGDIRIVAAFDIDSRKVGRPLNEAMFAPPNCTTMFCRDIPFSEPIVQMGPILDGVAEHMSSYPDHRTFLPSDQPPVDVAQALKDSGADIALNYLPVGSEKAAAFYARCALEAGVSLVNCMPVFIVSNAAWASRFEAAGLPVVGDDIKAQLGATILHRTLVRLFEDRGVKIDRTYQLNTGGNTDFLNMLEQGRLSSKRISKTAAVTSQLDSPLEGENIHIGPSDYVPWQNDNKVCFLRIEGRGFGDVPLHVEARLSVEDSPNSAGIVIDAIRCCQVARDRRLAGPILPACAYFMKHPPVQMEDGAARRDLEKFIAGVEQPLEHAAPCA